MPAGKIGRETIEWYLSRGKKLCLLDGNPKLDAKLRGKKPLNDKWTTTKESFVSLLNHTQKGGNLGFVLSPNDCVIDVDPRNGGDESFKILERDLGGIDLRSICPVVESGGGGIHLYLSKSPAEEIRKKSARYKGIDFLTEGSHVVIPGSFHFGSGKYYEFDDLSAYDELKFPPIPEAILKHIRKVRDPGEPLHKSGKSPDLTNEELAELLDQIDPEDYRGRHDDWLSLMFACHQATNGDGRRAFVDWCVRDKKYAADEGLIIYRWDSLLDDEQDLVTYRTLLKAVREVGGEIPDHIDRKCKIAEYDVEEMTAISEFDAIAETLESDFDDLGPADDDERAVFYEQQKEVREQAGKTKFEALLVSVSALTHETVTQSKIEKIAKLCDGFDEVEVSKIQGAVCKFAKLSLPEIRRAFAKARRETLKREAFDNVPKDILGPLETFTGDIVPIAVAKILKAKYRHGNTICKGQDGGVYVYNGKIWEPISGDEVDGITREALAMADPSNPDVAKYMPKCKTVLFSILRTIDFTKLVSSTFDIFNFQNCEIWVDTQTGKRTKKMHDFRSNLTSVLPYDFDNDADCDDFSNALKGIVSCYGEGAKEVERHLWELYGYTLTRRKNIATFVAFTGPGGNGKSVLLSAIGAVAGESALFGSITDFGSGRSAHAYAQLVGKIAFVDDDAEYGAKLPSDVLKKLSENKTLPANPKYKKAFQFENRSICWLASNAWPYTGDTSAGIRRRAHIFHLTNEFRQGNGADLSLTEKIKAEAPGLFNKMIKGLIRLRKRGFFLIPKALQKTAVTWESRTNPVASYLIEGEDVDTSCVENLYDGYKTYCFETGRGDRISIPKFREMVEALGCHINYNIIIPDRLIDARTTFLKNRACKKF